MLVYLLKLVSGFAGILVLIRWILTKKYGSIDKSNEINAKGKIIIITGANSGVGLATAQEFAERDAHVILACRDMNKAAQAIDFIRRQTSKGQMIAMQCDLASLDSVRKFASEFKKKYEKLDILVNNGAVMLPPNRRLKTADGFEIHFGVNHLGHFLLTNLLLDNLKKAEPSRVITVSAIAHLIGKLDFNDLQGEKANYDGLKDRTFFGAIGPGNQAYSNSKLANALFSAELALRLEGSGVKTYALCPGVVSTNLANEAGIPKALLFFIKPLLNFLLKTPKEGAATTMYCALSKDLMNSSGEMFQHCALWLPKHRIPLPEKDAAKLWDISAKLVKLK